MRIFVFIFVASLATALFTSVYCTANAESQSSISASPYLLERVKNNDWLLLDVRSPQEYEQGHIPGAINVPHDKLDSYLASIDNYKDKPVIVYCRSGRRASLAIKQLKSKQFNHVQHLEGDMLGWQDTGLPVKKLPLEKM